MSPWSALMFSVLLAARSVTADQCNTICGPDIERAASGQTTGCTNAIVQEYAKCLDCGDLLSNSQAEAADPRRAADSQHAIDIFVSGCNADGHPVKDVTVAGAMGLTEPTSTGSSIMPSAQGSDHGTRNHASVLGIVVGTAYLIARHIV
ncbi:hypothetical protein B0H10DRAFT_1954867 [Mycena sp. CBHHK59/15]|nr:hypothetical protein B0H10DRAFT_1954867 [Mycena sp. CBHHK59/15]